MRQRTAQNVQLHRFKSMIIHTFHPRS